MAVSRKRLTEFWHPAEAGGKAGIGQQRRAAAGEPDQENMDLWREIWNTRLEIL